MTYLEMCQKVIRDLGMKNTLSTVAGQSGMNQKIVDWIADADEDIQSIWFDWDFLFNSHSDTTIIGQLEYTAPSGLGTWDEDSFYLNYTSDDYIHLQPMSYSSWRSTHRQGTQTNDEPSHFIIAQNKNIYLQPKPDAAYALTANYWKTPTRMSVNTSTSLIPSRFQRIILARAKIYWAEHEEFPAVLELATTEYRELLARLEADSLNGKRPHRMSSSDLVVRAE